ncbi:MAG: 2Fe-2S iron-sulfur cluster binding domain-containing protein [Deltaproteobacteria bacterium]|nr:2Fe-2S iron-sulfur cluster binding domain-containing protein [Deltaproteobacteria bacterium]
MAGVNPYLQPNPAHRANRPFRVVVRGQPDAFTVDPAQLPYGRDGEPGSLLDILLHHGVRLDHACGGICSCSTCHVIVRRGGHSCSPASESEEDMLDTAPGLTAQSRLACQCVPDGSEEIEVEIPSWNRNQVREDDL